MGYAYGEIQSSGGGTGPHTIISDVHTDTDAAAVPAGGNSMVFDGTSGLWVPRTLAASDIDAAPSSHVGSTGGHPLATTTAQGLVSGADKSRIDAAVQQEASVRTVYVSTTGSDTTGTGTSAAPWRTIQRAINDARVTMPTAGGNYQILLSNGIYQETLVIPANLAAAFNAVGQGGIWIKSINHQMATVRHSGNNAAFDIFGSCSLEGLIIEGDVHGVLVRGSPSTLAFVYNCNIRRAAGVDGTGNAIAAQVGNVYSRENTTTTGARFSTGLNSRYGSTISKYDTVQPTGYTQNELVNNAGVIR